MRFEWNPCPLLGASGVKQLDRAADSSGTTTFVRAIAIRLPDVAEHRGCAAPEVTA